MSLAFKIVSNNPNNKDIRVEISDSTINTNRQYKVLKARFADNKVKATMIKEEELTQTFERKQVGKTFSDEEIIISEILSVDLNNITPLDSLKLMARWKKELSGI